MSGALAPRRRSTASPTLITVAAAVAATIAVVERVHIHVAAVQHSLGRILRIRHGHVVSSVTKGNLAVSGGTAPHVVVPVIHRIRLLIKQRVAVTATVADTSTTVTSACCAISALHLASCRA